MFAKRGARRASRFFVDGIRVEFIRMLRTLRTAMILSVGCALGFEV